MVEAGGEVRECDFEVVLAGEGLEEALAAGNDFAAYAIAGDETYGSRVNIA